MNARVRLMPPMVAARRRAKLLVGEHQFLLPLFLRVTFEGTGRNVTEETDLVVEGFPRSGTTFTSTAIRLAQPEGFVVTDHVHNIAILDRAIAAGVPTLVVVREPRSCLTSYLVWEPRAPVSCVLWEWDRYHRKLLDRRDSVVVRSFEQVRSSLAEVTDALSARYSVQLRTPPSTAEFSAMIDDAVRARHARVHPRLPAARGVPVPDAGRATALAEQRARLDAPQWRERLGSLNALYELLTTSENRRS